MAQQRTRWIGGAALVAAIAAGGWWFLAPPDVTPPPAESTAAEPAALPETLRLPAQEARAIGLEWAIVEAVEQAPIAALSGTIEPPANARVAVTALFGGVIEHSYVVEGSAVRKGQPLAVVRSPEILSLHSDLVRAQARLGIARSTAQRLDQLSDAGVIAGARAEEARASLREAEADVAEKRRILALAGGSGSDGSYRLRAPISGRVTSVTATTGDRLDGGSAPFVIDAAGAYEVNAQLPERFAGRVHPGMQVRLGDVTGTVSSVGTTLDPETRSLLLKARVPAGPGVISGGIVTVTVLGPAPSGAVMVPASAVTTLNGTQTVFVRTQDGVATREVRLGEGSADDMALVLSGLNPGDQVVKRGTSELKALVLAQ
ncbi:efflux RND transporter periplasmic adaptor subunit [Stakelama tenebrarum]|uniref:Efflux RND transporter periplasmic adaptor subunit n=1 Tax=Stakelama tenebrarum TaxID=2711215 RepID=A0A6G6Y2C5_9SPHN|nr:efflux RND transporter periplasmic adaptor subunit [Sphingosinithalassobacter tenebrarum]QIG79049.1 efflux RND transporter periplasmic adaptor subunit [Sphingosinithalassobacter tenebrarum]